MTHSKAVCCQDWEPSRNPDRCAGSCDSSDYPLQKKRHGLEFLRGIAHLRARSNIIGSIMRVRSALAQATHTFFSQHGFLYIHTPIISASDCEGAGEMFQVCHRF
jgi:asparaginyl-tRNA synthetase